MIYEYTTQLRTSRMTSGHECEELDELLNEYGAAGWCLVQISYPTVGHQLLIFERTNHAADVQP